MAVLILVVTVIISLYALNSSIDIRKYILSPYDVYHKKKYWQIISSGFLHQDMMHLLFNMFSYYFFAFIVEDFVGGITFALIYFGSMIIADIPTIINNKDNYGYRSLGASGAVSGIVFSSVLINPGAKLMVFPIPLPLPGFIFAILYLIYCHIATKKAEDNINHNAHLWGAIGGIVLTLLLFPESIGLFFDYFNSI